MTKVEILQQKYDSLKSQLKTLKEQLQTTGNSFFKESVKDLFETYPDLIAFSWTQYTPYFNDGDPCYFSANTDCIKLEYREDKQPDNADAENESYDEDDDDSGESFSKYNCTFWKGNKLIWKDNLTTRQQAGSSILKLLELFDEDFYEQTFGDHIRVKVSRDCIETLEHYHS